MTQLEMVTTPGRLKLLGEPVEVKLEPSVPPMFDDRFGDVVQFTWRGETLDVSVDFLHDSADVKECMTQLYHRWLRSGGKKRRSKLHGIRCIRFRKRLGRDKDERARQDPPSPTTVTVGPPDWNTSRSV